MKSTSKTVRIIIYIGLVFWLIVNLFPVYWMFTFSFKSNAEIFGENVNLFFFEEKLLCLRWPVFSIGFEF